MGDTPIAARGSKPKEKRVNWLAITFGAQVILFGTFIIAFFTIEQSRTSEMHEMQSELHRLRKENYKASKQLMQYNKRMLEKEEKIEQDIKGDVPHSDEGDPGAAKEDEGEYEDEKTAAGSDPAVEGPGSSDGSRGAATKSSAPAGCAQLDHEWWIYEVCLGRHVRQFHNKDAKGDAEGHLIGAFSAVESTPTSQNFVNGEVCRVIR